MSKRDIFAELMEGFNALEKARQGNVALHATTAELKPPPEMGEDGEVRTGSPYKGKASVDVNCGDKRK